MVIRRPPGSGPATPGARSIAPWRPPSAVRSRTPTRAPTTTTTQGVEKSVVSTAGRVGELAHARQRHHGGDHAADRAGQAADEHHRQLAELLEPAQRTVRQAGHPQGGQVGGPGPPGGRGRDDHHQHRDQHRRQPHQHRERQAPGGRRRVELRAYVVHGGHRRPRSPRAPSARSRPGRGLRRRRPTPRRRRWAVETSGRRSSPARSTTREPGGEPGTRGNVPTAVRSIWPCGPAAENTPSSSVVTSAGTGSGTHAWNMTGGADLRRGRARRGCRPRRRPGSTSRPSRRSSAATRSAARARTAGRRR